MFASGTRQPVRQLLKFKAMKNKNQIITMLRDNNIPWTPAPNGAQIKRKYYDINLFVTLNTYFIDSTFIVYFPEDDNDTANFIEDQENAYFDNFCINNNI